MLNPLPLTQMAMDKEPIALGMKTPCRIGNTMVVSRSAGGGGRKTEGNPFFKAPGIKRASGRQDPPNNPELAPYTNQRKVDSQKAGM